MRTRVVSGLYGGRRNSSFVGKLVSETIVVAVVSATPAGTRFVPIRVGEVKVQGATLRSSFGNTGAVGESYKQISADGIKAPAHTAGTARVSKVHAFATAGHAHGEGVTHIAGKAVVACLLMRLEAGHVYAEGEIHISASVAARALSVQCAASGTVAKGVHNPSDAEIRIMYHKMRMNKRLHATTKGSIKRT